MTEKEEPGQLVGFEAKLRGIESLIKKALQSNSNLTLNLNFYDGANIGQHIDRTDKANVWMNKEKDMEIQNIGEVEGKDEFTTERLLKGIQACQDLFWGKSCFAIVYCVCRDCFGYNCSVSQFERELEMHVLDCPTGTITSALKNNPYMKLPLNKWNENQAKQRVMAIVERFRETVEGLQWGKAG